MADYTTKAGGGYGRLGRTIRVTIPARIVRQFGIGVGDNIEWSVISPGLIVMAVHRMPRTHHVRPVVQKQPSRRLATRFVRRTGQRPAGRVEGLEEISGLDEFPDPFDELDPFGDKPIRNPDGSIMTQKQYDDYCKKVEREMDEEEEEEESEEEEAEEEEPVEEE